MATAAPDRWESPGIHPSTVLGVSVQGWALPPLSSLPQPAWCDLLPSGMQSHTLPAWAEEETRLSVTFITIYSIARVTLTINTAQTQPPLCEPAFSW